MKGHRVEVQLHPAILPAPQWERPMLPRITVCLLLICHSVSLVQILHGVIRRSPAYTDWWRDIMEEVGLFLSVALQTDQADVSGADVHIVLVDSIAQEFDSKRTRSTWRRFVHDLKSGGPQNGGVLSDEEAEAVKSLAHERIQCSMGRNSGTGSDRDRWTDGRLRSVFLYDASTLRLQDGIPFWPSSEEAARGGPEVATFLWEIIRSLSAEWRAKHETVLREAALLQHQAPKGPAAMGRPSASAQPPALHRLSNSGGADDAAAYRRGFLAKQPSSRF